MTDKEIKERGRLIEILHIGNLTCVIQRENKSITEHIDTSKLMEEVNQCLDHIIYLEDFKEY